MTSVFSQMLHTQQRSHNPILSMQNVPHKVLKRQSLLCQQATILIWEFDISQNHKQLTPKLILLLVGIINSGVKCQFLQCQKCRISDIGLWIAKCRIVGLLNFYYIKSFVNVK